MPPVPKQHHYIPQVYLRAFSDVEGFVSIVDLWREGRVIRTKPSNVLKERDLYTQPVHAEARFDTSFETLFSEIEGRWPPVVDALKRKAPITEPLHEALIEFISALRVRVPNSLKASSRLLQHMGELAIEQIDGPPLPPELLNALKKSGLPFEGGGSAADLLRAGIANLSIDPHRALSAMPNLVKSLLPILGRNGILTFVHNKTPLPFIASDNPVIYFHRSSDEQIVPYRVSRSGDFELYFPVTPNVALRYATFSKNRLQYRNVHSAAVVRSLNDLVAQFADRFVVASGHLKPLDVTKHADRCPVPDLRNSVATPTGEILRVEYEWGSPIKNLPKWDYEFEPEK